MSFGCILSMAPIKRILKDIETVIREFGTDDSAIDDLMVEDLDLLRQGPVSYTRSYLMDIESDSYGTQEILVQWARLVRCGFVEYVYQPHSLDDVIVICWVTDKGADYLTLMDHELDTRDKGFPAVY